MSRGPITAELRAAIDVDREFMRADGTVVAQTFCVDRDDFHRLCDAIDAVHAGLERENAELRQRVAVLDESADSMHDGGSITSELREYAEAYEGSATHASLDLIADRIDAEHESACAEAYGNGVMSVPIALDESAWVKLPVDADGEYIRIGDVLTDDAEFKSEGKVMRLMLEDEGWMVGIGYGGWSTPSLHEWHHHHAPTVEDVLDEYRIRYYDLVTDMECKNITNEEYARGIDNLNVEYATKLRLAEVVDA